MRVLGINALFHDPSAALVVDGQIVAAAEEERFSRRKHGKRPVPFSAWELPELSARWCLAQAGLGPADLDAVAYSYDPALARPAEALGLDDPWDDIRQDYARRAPEFLSTALPGLDPATVVFVPHHVSHALSAAPIGEPGPWDVIVADGRGEQASSLVGHHDGERLETLHTQDLPHSIGLLYESLTEHLGFLRSSDEYKVMALASYGKPRFVDILREHVHVTGDGGFVTWPVDWSSLVERRKPGDDWTGDHADLAASLQRVVEDTMLDLAGWLHDATGTGRLALAGGVALNCVANTRLFDEGPYQRVWVQPAAGDAGTALGAALALTGPLAGSWPGPALGSRWTDGEIESELRRADVPYERPDDIAEAVAAHLAMDQLVGWFQGASEFGPRALGHRSLLADPRSSANVERLNAVKGREEFRPVAPMVREADAARIFTRGPLPSPHMLFVHDVTAEWVGRIPAVVHVDGTARVQTVPDDDSLLARLLAEFARLTGVPVLVNTSLNTAGRPMVDSPRDALELFGSAPLNALAMGPFLLTRPR